MQVDPNPFPSTMRFFVPLSQQGAHKRKIMSSCFSVAQWRSSTCHCLLSTRFASGHKKESACRWMEGEAPQPKSSPLPASAPISWHHSVVLVRIPPAETLPIGVLTVQNRAALPYSCTARVPQSVSIGNSSRHWLSQRFRSANYLFLVMTNKSKWRIVLEGVYFKIHWLRTKVGTALTAAAWIAATLSPRSPIFGFLESLGKGGVWLFCFILKTTVHEAILFGEKRSLPWSFFQPNQQRFDSCSSAKEGKAPQSSSDCLWLHCITGTLDNYARSGCSCYSSPSLCPFAFADWTSRPPSRSLSLAAGGGLSDGCCLVLQDVSSFSPGNTPVCS